MVKKFFNNDDSQVSLPTREDLQKYLDHIKANDVWITPYINELGAVGIPRDEPLLYPEYCHDIKLIRHGCSMLIGNLDWTNEENAECIQNKCVFLISPWGGSDGPYRILPTRMIAMPSILKRAGDTGSIMIRTDSTAGTTELPIRIKGERLAEDFQHYGGSCKILYRDGKVSACHSSAYAVIPAWEAVSALETYLKREHPHTEYDTGLVSHEYLVAEYLLNDKVMEENFRLKMNDAGADIAELHAGVRFATSDVAQSRVWATIFYDADGVRTTMCEGIGIEHKGEATVQDFADALPDLDILFNECEQRIEELGNMDIMDVSFVVGEVAEAYQFIPKGKKEELVAETKIRFPKGGTGIDVFLALNDIIQRHAKAKQLSATRYVALCQQVARLMKLPFDRIDRGEEWKK